MPESQRSNPWKIGFLILAIAVVLWVGYAVTVPRLFMSWEKSNQFGGMFGGIGALFSGLALAGVVVAVLMQKEELELQREELKKSVAAQTASSESSPTASDTLKRGVRYTIMRMGGLDPGGVVQYYWSAIIGTERSTEFARQMRAEGFTRFEEVIDEVRDRFDDQWLRA